ncbi:MAG TPA: MerR family transcriptional regulator [Candidatus Scybalocola faecavium]|nr:MerR family transcriptional regulator [Candidatus Scybalocola faecavium]
MEDLFSIGEVSKYQNISKQTLIFYDKIGLFCPAYVDPNNGYRYYSASQIDRLDTILIMKKIGFSLKEIKEHMEHYTIDSSLVALRNQISVIDRQIRELELIRSRVVHRCGQMEAARACQANEPQVILESAPARHLLFEPVNAPYTLKEISIATKKCFAEAFKKHLPIFFQSGVIVPLERIRQGHYTQASTAFLPIEPTDQAKNIQAMPAGKCAAIYHVGDYLSIGRSYEKLLSYCQTHNLEIISDSYEFCINDYITTRDENEYITKILFYVKTETSMKKGCEKGI